MLTVERMYELARRTARTAPTHPACDYEDLIQCAVVGMVQAEVRDEALAVVIAKRRIVDELRRQRGRAQMDAPPGRASVAAAQHLYRPVARPDRRTLADLLPDEEDALGRVVDQLAAEQEAAPLMRAVGRLRKHVLVWHVADDRSVSEIACRTGLTPWRVRRLLDDARDRARRAHAAQGADCPAAQAPPQPPGDGADSLEATPAEKRAFGDFRRLQRAGLRQREALSAMPPEDRARVASYQRKATRRARARAAGADIPKAQRGGRRYDHEDQIPISDGERAAAGALWTLRSRGSDLRAALQLLPPDQRGLAQSYQSKMRARTRVRTRRALAG